MIKYILKSKSGEATVSTGIKIVIAVVIGALLIGGLYLLFSADNGVIAKMNEEVGAMMDYGEGGITVQRILNDAGTYDLKYSYDGKHWNDVTMPDYGEGATVYGTLSGGEGENASYAALIQNGNRYYLIASKDGINWLERFTTNATAITHFYYGTNRLPATSGSYLGEKFVIRYKNGNYYSSAASDATKWSKPTWSDLIPAN